MVTFTTSELPSSLSLLPIQEKNNETSDKKERRGRRRTSLLSIRSKLYLTRVKQAKSNRYEQLKKRKSKPYADGFSQTEILEVGSHDIRREKYFDSRLIADLAKLALNPEKEELYCAEVVVLLEKKSKSSC
ncbi:hypothetical protein KFK09_017944 [Dendrobium nobile]|uniref:Uncharacterized protein n=1 Tax=Dendrobium nobile TaxID=94219 RepID=A0A8T3ASY0_DENNO|nr:hypothetical protein KFK09_017944 [Dendrobium nobile]